MTKFSIVIYSLLIASVLADVTLVASEFSDETFGNNQVVGWTITGSYENQQTSICSSVSLLGGYNVFGSNAKASKVFDSGVDHNELFISFDLFTIDSWGNLYLKTQLAQLFFQSKDNETVFVYIDDVLVYQFQAHQSTPSVIPISCGLVAYQDRINTIGIKVPHFRRDFQIKITSNLNEAGYYESWGIRDLYIIASYDNAIKVVASEFQQSNFKASSEGWEIIGVDKGKEFTECGQYKLFGGYNTFGKGSLAQKSYSNLGEHYGVIVNFDILMIDSPETIDYIGVAVDGQLYKFSRPDIPWTDPTMMMCGNNYSEYFMRGSIFVPHIGPEVSITFKGVYDQAKDNESFGILNLRILTTYCASCAVVYKEYTEEQFGAGKGWQTLKGQDVSSTLSTCGGVNYFGPHKGDIQKQFSQLPQHDGLRIFFRLATSGSWNDSTKVSAWTDNAQQLIQASLFTQRNVCQKNDETVRNYFIDAPHSTSTLSFKLLLSGNRADTAYLIRDFLIFSYQNRLVTPIAKEFNDPQIASSDGWLVQGNKGGVAFSSCGDISLFGGLNTFGKKTIATKTFNLPKHSFVYITFQILYIDAWDWENFVVRIDDEIASVTTKDEHMDGHYALCGWEAAKEEGHYIKIYAPHSSNTLKLTLQDYLDEDYANESWGIRNLVISAGDFKIPKRYKCNGSNNGPTTTTVNEGPIQVQPTQPSQPPQQDSCVQLFAECQFGGASYGLCESAPSLKASGWKVPIKSIKIPKGKSLSLFSKSDFAGDGLKFTESQSCLSGSDYSAVNKYFNIDVSQAGIKSQL